MKVNLIEAEKLKEHILDMLKRNYDRHFSIYVVYKPSCGCDETREVLLDRYPMSQKIHGKCHECVNYLLFEISNPIKFYCPWEESEYSLHDLFESYLPDSPQKPFLECYLRELNNSCLS